ncbi:hypothetical protein N752_24610 [Desulforamulus aquiferis]|nr:hypothetical protein [Desulforamulus aquiferis]RYD02514.1 hypothetical protein N752_24610 [Desulforamulus aquiferis]
MLVNIKPVTIFTANLGSGKTEISINFSQMLQQRGEKVSLVDLDIINPYFRTRLAKDNLASRGLKVICPPGHLINADVPALTPAVRGHCRPAKAIVSVMLAVMMWEPSPWVCINPISRRIDVIYILWLTPVGPLRGILQVCTK